MVRPQAVAASLYYLDQVPQLILHFPRVLQGLRDHLP